MINEMYGLANTDDGYDAPIVLVKQPSVDDNTLHDFSSDHYDDITYNSSETEDDDEEVNIDIEAEACKRRFNEEDDLNSDDEEDDDDIDSTKEGCKRRCNEEDDTIEVDDKYDFFSVDLDNDDEDDEEDDDDNEDYEDSEACGESSIYIYDDMNIFNEGTNIESIRAWFSSKEKDKAVSDLKLANKLFKKSRYKEAKNEYLLAAKELKECEKHVRDLDESVASTVLSWALCGAYFVNFMNLVISVQVIVDDKDWWKPTEWIREFIISIKNFFKDPGDWNFIRTEIVSAMQWLREFAERRAAACDAKMKTNSYKR